MRIRLASLLLASTVSLVGFAGAGCSSDDSASLTITNSESFSITDIYIDSSGFDTSDNLLSDGALAPTASITVSVDCGTYDVEIIDSSGTDCYITGYNLCGTDDTWDLDDGFFGGCAAAARK